MKYLFATIKIAIPITIWFTLYLLYERHINFDSGLYEFIYYFLVTAFIAWVNIKLRRMLTVNKG